MLEERKCSKCGAIYDPRTRYCQKDGKPLVVTKTLIGRTLHGKYRIEDWLGGGGMANVYRATHLKMGEEVAVKVLNPDLVEIERLADRFRNEARAAMRVNHQNAVKVTDFDITEDNLHYLVMEIVKGHLLRDLIDEGAFNYRRAVKILSQACEAIDAAHKQGIIHRDLKPDNIIVQDVGGAETVKVLDFGIARLRDPENSNSSKAVYTAPGILMGTPRYMSPEQCQSKELGPASDVYSMGIIAYEMLAGRTPFTPTGDLREFFYQVKNDSPPPLRFFSVETPQSIERVIMRALEKAPENRPASAAALAQELRRAVKEADSGITDPLITDTTIMYESDGDTSPDIAITYAPANAKIKTRDAKKKVSTHGFRWDLVAGVTALAIVLIVLYWVFLGKERPPKTAGTITITDEYGDMVLIPGGKFKMGRVDGDADERPEHEVEVKDFYLDKYEVTNQQYKKFVDATGHRAPSHWKNGSFATEEALTPVTYVTWNDAADYAKWAKKRLPTEEEWEYAARGGKGFLYPWGNEWREGSANAGIGAPKPLSVRSYEKDLSEFGVFGMAGNVSEWVDGFHLPYDPTATGGCPQCRIYRGGNFKSTAKASATTSRLSDYPDIPTSEADREAYEKLVFPRVGFRCAK
jgi:serine/threonine-protein kinase